MDLQFRRKEVERDSFSAGLAGRSDRLGGSVEIREGADWERSAVPRLGSRPNSSLAFVLETESWLDLADVHPISAFAEIYSILGEGFYFGVIDNITRLSGGKAQCAEGTRGCIRSISEICGYLRAFYRTFWKEL